MNLVRNQLRRAFTLMELIIAIGISSFIVISLYGVFTSQSQRLLIQDMQMEMHQNGRFGLEILTRSIRMAGFGTARGLVYGAMGYGGDSSNLPALISYDADGSNGQDSITVVYMEPSLVMDTAYDTLEACTTNTITFNPQFLDNSTKLMQFKQGDLLLCQDYAAIGNVESYLWSITSDASGASPFGTIYVDDSVTSLTDYSAVCSSSDNLTPVMRCSKGQVMTFYIDDDYDGIGPGSEEHPVLMMDLNMNYPNNDDIPLVDNIEDLQIEYCMDDGTQSVNCSDEQSWVHSFVTGDIEKAWGVRISLVVRSPKTDPTGMHTSSRPRVANHTASNTTDGYFRDVVSSSVAVRNIRLLASQ